MIRNLLFISAIIFAFNGYAQEILFEEDFNDESTWENWTLEDRDGDGELWEFGNAEFEEIDSFDGGFVWSFSWYFDTFTPDNLLISPAFQIPTDSDVELTFKVAAFEDDELFQEHYAVYLIPAYQEFTGNEYPIFEETLDAAYYNPPKTVNVNISDGGDEYKLVFRHYDCTDIFYISLDDIKVEMLWLGVNNHTQNKIKVYPNPTTDVVRIEGVENVDRIRVFDLHGKMVKEVNAAEANLEQLQAGVYLVNFYTDTHVYSRRVVKE